MKVKLQGIIKYKITLRMTIQDPPSFSGRVWKRISNDARHFVESNYIILSLDLLPKDPKKRLTIKQALDHPWINITKTKKGILSKFRDYAQLNDK
jgi:serine/threonine protein kinase